MMTSDQMNTTDDQGATIAPPESPLDGMISDMQNCLSNPASVTRETLQGWISDLSDLKDYMDKEESDEGDQGDQNESPDEGKKPSLIVSIGQMHRGGKY